MTPPNAARTIMAHLLTFRPLYRGHPATNRLGAAARAGLRLLRDPVLLRNVHFIPTFTSEDDTTADRALSASPGSAAACAAPIDHGAVGGSHAVEAAWSRRRRAPYSARRDAATRFTERHKGQACRDARRSRRWRGNTG